MRVGLAGIMTTLPRNESSWNRQVARERTYPQWLHMKAGELVPFPAPARSASSVPSGWLCLDVEEPSRLRFVPLGIAGKRGASPHVASRSLSGVCCTGGFGLNQLCSKQGRQLRILGSRVKVRSACYCSTGRSSRGRDVVALLSAVRLLWKVVSEK